MLTRTRRLFNQFLNRSRKINNEPLNKVSLIVIILIDIFILINVFSGLDDISRWFLSPTQAYPCYSEWQAYQTQTATDKNYQILRQALPIDTTGQLSTRQFYQQDAIGHLGTVSTTCLQYADYRDRIRNASNQQLIRSIDQKQSEIDTFSQKNRTIQQQYDSTLLEQIAGQSQEQSINQVGAEQAKQELDRNNQAIATRKQAIATLKAEFLAKPESVAFITFLQTNSALATVTTGYQHASFWYPSIQLAFQSLFLLPLIFVALAVHWFAQRRGYGLIALISWHLLVIFFIPLILKVFEFLQVGVLFQFFFNIIQTLFGGLLFLVSYLYILLIPLVGFGLIKFFQRIVLNPKLQAVNRIQNLRCIKCAKRLRHQDTYCPHCGYDQYLECAHCHQPTYKYLPYCHHCGHTQSVRLDR